MNNLPADVKKSLLTSYYFKDLVIDEFPMLMEPDELVWNCLDRLEAFILGYLNRFKPVQKIPDQLKFWERNGLGGGKEKTVFVAEGFETSEPLAIPQWGIYLASGVVLEPGAMLKGPLMIGAHSEIRQCAYLRGNVLVGAHCTVGHTTEVKNSIFMGHSEAGHFAYVGDSILGKYVNLGAGTKLANLPFRTLDNKKNIAFPPLSFKIMDHPLHLSRGKLGAILGDGVETGCNTSISPCTFLGPDSWVYPCLSIPKGFYPQKSLIKPGVPPSVLKKEIR